MKDLPLYTLAHKSDIAILDRREVDDPTIELVPLILTKRAGEITVCAFCDIERPSQ